MCEPLQTMLNELCSITNNSLPFLCKDAILYTPSSTGQFLEPRFYSKSLYASHFFPIDVNLEQPLSGLVSHAFQSSEPKVSLAPIGDDRIGDVARLATMGYQFTNSMIALPVIPILAENQNAAPIGVLLLHTSVALAEDPSPGFEKAFWYQIFAIAALLQHIETETHRRFANQLSYLSSTFLTSIRPVLQPIEVLQKFSDFCRESFPARECFFFLAPDSDTCPREEISIFSDHEIPSLLREMLRSAKSSFHEIDSNTAVVVLNYGHESKTLFDSLNSFMPEICRWILLARRAPGGRTVFAAIARPCTDGEVWSKSDVLLLNHTVGHFLLLLGRAAECDHLLKTLDRGASLSETAGLSPSQFQAVVYISREFLNMDQVLICSVERTEKGLRIVGRFADGFGKEGESERLKAGTNRLLPFAAASKPPSFAAENWNDVEDEAGWFDEGKIDITALIAHLYFYQNRSELPKAFRVSHQKSYQHFTLDRKLASDCHIDSDVIFLPCVASGSDGSTTLRGILVLGSSTGHPPMNGREQTLQNLASQIAASMASDERLFIDERLKRIRSQGSFTLSSLQCIAEKAALTTRAMVARVWLRIDLVAMLIGRPLRREPIAKAFQRYLQSVARNGLWRESPPGVRLTAAFFGVSVSEMEEIGRSATDSLASYVVDHLYLPVAHWDVIDQSDMKAGESLLVLFDALSSLEHQFRSQPDDCLFCKSVECVMERCYLPGYGLTGWSLRYIDAPVRLDNLTETEGDRIHQQVLKSPHDFQLKAVDLMIKRDVPASAIGNGESLSIPSPVISQHVRDHYYKIRQPLDTVMCVPFGTLEPLEYPRGILRVALSSSPTGIFDEEDESRLDSIASHLTELLMSKMFRWERSVSQYDVGPKLQNFLAHRLKRFGQDAARLRSELSNDPNVSDGLKLASKGVDIVARTVDRIEATRQFLRGLAFDDGELLSAESVSAYIVHWFEKHSYGVPVSTSNSTVGQVSTFKAEWLIDLCLLVDEIVFNACIHSNPSPQCFEINLNCDGGIRLEVVERGCRDRYKAVPSEGNVHVPSKTNAVFSALRLPFTIDWRSTIKKMLSTSSALDVDHSRPADASQLTSSSCSNPEFDLKDDDLMSINDDALPSSQPYKEFLDSAIHKNAASGKRGRGAFDIAVWEKNLGVRVMCSMGNPLRHVYRIDNVAVTPTMESSLQKGPSLDVSHTV